MITPDDQPVIPQDAARDFLDHAPCGLLSVDADGCVTYANKKFAALIGRAGQSLPPGERFHDLLSAPSRIRYSTHIEPLVLSAGSVDEVSLEFKRPAGPPLPALVNFVAVPAEDHARPTIRVCVFEAAAHVQAARDARHAQANAQQLASIVAASTDAILGLGCDLEILSWNNGAARLLGYGEIETLGRRVDLLFIPEELRQDLRRGYAALLAGRHMVNFESRCLHKDGHLIDVEINSAPIVNDRGDVVAFSAIVRDITERRRATQALQSGRAALQAALDVANMAAWGWDNVKEVKQWSKEALALFGLPPDTVMTRDLFLSFLDEADLARYQAAWTAAMNPDGPRVYALDFHIDRRNDGARRRISSKAAVEFEDDQPVRVVGALRDVTDEEAARDHIRMLLDEINHRSKNLLSVVQAIALQTAKYSDTDDFVKEFSSRLAALAANQDLLIKEYWRGANIAELIHSQLAPFRSAAGDRFHFNGPPLRLSPSAAQALGMALHELATNAAKYGALSNADGSVTLNWSIEQDDAPRLRIMWREQNGPPVRAPERHGFGQVVLRRLTSAAFRGEATLDYHPDGVVWTLDAALDDVCDADPRLDTLPWGGRHAPGQAASI